MADITYKINDFVTIDRFKNGRKKIEFKIRNESNVYRLLKTLGYCYAKVEGKVYYYRRIGDNLIPQSVLSIKQAFGNFLTSASFSDLPGDLTLNEVRNWELSKRPVKVNGLFKDHLHDKLTSEEVHRLRMKTDVEYSHQFEINFILDKFKQWGLKQGLDQVGSFSKGNPLYYKDLGNQKFLVFNFFNAKRKLHSGFDCWLATFVQEKHIGHRKPLSNQDIRLGFQFEKDYALIKRYVG